MLKVRTVVVTLLAALVVVGAYRVVAVTTNSDEDLYELVVTFKPANRPQDVVIKLAVGAVVPERGLGVAQEIARVRTSPFERTVTYPRGLRLTLYATQTVSGELIVAIINRRTGGQGTGVRRTSGTVGCTV